MSPRIAVPAYAYPHPESRFWAQLASAAPAVGLVVANPSNGPGQTSDANYIAAVELITGRGVAVLGYVSTAYAQRTLADVLSDVRRWYDWYQIDGVFFDEVSAEHASWGYYEELSRSVRARAGRVVLNPGTHTPERYMEMCDVLLNFEGPLASYRDAYADNPAWVAHYAPGRFWHIVHTCATAPAQRLVLQLARARNAGWLFVTTGSGSNPYDQLPSGRYWARELGWTTVACVAGP